MVPFRRCTENEFQRPFHVQKTDGKWDRSRTWMVDFDLTSPLEDPVPPPWGYYEDGRGLSLR